MKDDYRMGRALRALRSRCGMSVAAFAEAMGVAPDRVRRWEEGGLRPALAEIERALQILGVGHGDLVAWMERLEIEDP